MKRSIFFVLSFTAVAFTLLIYKKLEYQSYEDKAQPINKPHKATPNDIPLAMPEKHSTALSSANSQQSIIDPYKANKINEWLHERGYFSSAELSEYFAYDEHDLEKLVLNHDIKAIQALALQKIKQGELSKAYDLYLEAAALGCTYSLTAASSLKMSEQFLESDANTKEQLTIDSIALLKVGIMRNDVLIHEHYIQTVKDINRIVLSEEQERKINKKADKIYKSLQARRNELNLNQFDNSLPSEIHLFKKFTQP